MSAINAHVNNGVVRQQPLTIYHRRKCESNSRLYICCESDVSFYARNGLNQVPTLALQK